MVNKQTKNNHSPARATTKVQKKTKSDQKAETVQKINEKGTKTTTASARVFKLSRVYIKDASFNSPLTPAIFKSNQPWDPAVGLHLHTACTVLENDHYEIVLTVTATVKLGDEVAYKAKVKQAGIFLIKGFEKNRLEPLLRSQCPNNLYPFAREEIAGLAQKGGFPQLLLDPVNFDALFVRQKSAAMQQTASVEESADKPDSNKTSTADKKNTKTNAAEAA